MHRLLHLLVPGAWCQYCINHERHIPKHLVDLFAYTGIFNRSNPLNPFRNWTYVFIPYDTGDVFSGDRVMEYCGIGINGMMDCVTTYHVGFVDAIMAMRWAAAQGPGNKWSLQGLVPVA